MVQTMRAAVVRSFDAPLVIEEVPVPTLSPGEILVKIEASGVSHTDPCIVEAGKHGDSYKGAGIAVQVKSGAVFRQLVLIRSR